MTWISPKRFARVTPVSSRVSESKSNGQPRFIEIDVLRNAEGMKAVITQRASNNVLTFAIVREFERDGMVENTSYIPETLIEAFLDLVHLTKKRIAEIRASGKIEPVKTVSRR